MDPTAPEPEKGSVLSCPEKGSLEVIIFLGKLCGQNAPVEIDYWARNHAEALVRYLMLKRNWMPHHNTIRRVFQNILGEGEFERLMRAYQQRACRVESS